jgi:hypothetical protein
MIMSTLHVSGHPAAVRTDGDPGRGVLSRLFGAWMSYRRRVAQSYVDQYLQRFGDEELKEMGYTDLELARIRAAASEAPQHWI